MKCRKICAEQVGRYGKPILRVYCRTEDKRKFAINVDGLPSYFYVDREPVYFGDKLSKVEKIESGYYSIYGRPLWKVYTKAPGDTKFLREGYNHYEADIHWTERACIDLQLTDGFEYEDGKIIPCGNVDHIKLRTWILDVEVISPPAIVPWIRRELCCRKCSCQSPQYHFERCRIDRSRIPTEQKIDWRRV